MYKSGDLACFRDDGEIVYLARIDLQVKIRGVRTELGEVEAAMNAHPDIVESIALARPYGEELRLIGYAIVRRPLDLLELRAHLQKTLPEAMIPTAFVPVENWPVNANGKLERALLPDPESIAARLEPSGTLSPTERLLATIRAEVLDRKGIGPQDDFFALGGHSLLAARVIARLRHVERIGVSLRDLLRNPKLGAFAAVVEGSRKLPRANGRASVAARSATSPLSPMQQHLWFLDRLLGPNRPTTWPSTCISRARSIPPRSRAPSQPSRCGTRTWPRRFASTTAFRGSSLPGSGPGSTSMPTRMHSRANRSTSRPARWCAPGSSASKAERS